MGSIEGFDQGAGAGRSAVLDRPTGNDLGPEFAVLRLGGHPDLAGLLPRMRFDLRHTPHVVTDIVEGRPADERPLDPEVAAAVGATIGAWHRGSARHANGFSLAPVAWSTGAGDPLLRSVLGALRREWSAATVIHGDCRVANAVLVAGPNGCGGAQAVLTSWARSGTGDPAWDAGCLLADLFAEAATRGPASAAEPAMSAALAAYGRAVGAANLPAGFARRVALSLVARLVALASEAVERGGEPGRPRELLGLARSVAAWLPNWTARFERWLGVDDAEHDARRDEQERRSRAAHPAGRGREVTIRAV